MLGSSYENFVSQLRHFPARRLLPLTQIRTNRLSILRRLPPGGVRQSPGCRRVLPPAGLSLPFRCRSSVFSDQSLACVSVLMGPAAGNTLVVFSPQKVPKIASPSSMPLRVLISLPPLTVSLDAKAPPSGPCLPSSCPLRSYFSCFFLAVQYSYFLLVLFLGNVTPEPSSLRLGLFFSPGFFPRLPFALLSHGSWLIAASFVLF